MSKLAIVIPYYNIDFFKETLKSVAAQSNKNFTLYIGNDASPDNPVVIIGKYFKKMEYHYFEYKDNVGNKNLALQWERILENVKEDWFQILGDDDVIAENFVEEFYNELPILKNKQINTLKFVHEWIDSEGKSLETFDYNEKFINVVDFFMKKYNDEIKCSLSENIFKTEIYKKNGFEKIPLAWGSDDLALLAFSNYQKILYNRKSKVSIRISENSISGSKLKDGDKKFAFNIFREKIISNHSKHLPKTFTYKVIEEYLTFCHLHKKKANYIVTKSFLLHSDIESFLKNLKKIYYINKINKTKSND